MLTLRKTCLTAILTMLAILLGSCGAEPESPAPQHQMVSDLLGRSVIIRRFPKKIVCIGAGALRLYVYAGNLEYLCGVEQCEKQFLISARPYRMVNRNLFNSLPTIGLGGPTGQPDAEAILKVGPDVVFTTYTHDPPALDRLQHQLGTPVVALSYGLEEATDPRILQSLTLIGKIVGTEKKAAKLTDYIIGIQADLALRSEQVPEEERPTAYLACHSYYGAKGFGSTSANYSIFNALNIRNILSLYNVRGYHQQLQLEAVLTMNPQVIFVDAAGLPILRQQYKHHASVFQAMDAFKNNRVYVQLPYNAYHTNLELAYANAFFIAKTLYPEAFRDIDLAQKAEEISRSFLGRDTYRDVIRQLNGGFRKLTEKDLEDR